MENSQKPSKALKDASIHFGIIGTLSFIVFVLIFREDWTDKFQYLSYLLPLPVTCLLIARKYHLAGGMLLIALGAGTAVFDGVFSPAHPGQIAGRGLVYTCIFVSLPLAISGVLSIIYQNKTH